MDPVEEHVVVRFLAAVAEDAAAGRAGSLEHYLARFAGHDARLTAEWETLQVEAPATGVGESTDATTFGPYRLLRELGRGGQGVVYLAEDTRYRRTVALKLLPGFAGTGVPARVQREVEAIARLDHPGLCVVYEAGQRDGQAFLAMRYVPGESLEELIARESPPGPVPGKAAGRSGTGGRSRAWVLERVGLAEKVARALHTAHEAGVIHRDVKPANILVHEETGEPVVVDFGLARADETSVPTLTRTGDLVGTTQYMSPQRLLGEGSRDPRTDVWSLGVTLYEALTGRRPFDAPTVEGVARRIEAEEPVDPRRLQAGVDRDLAVVVATALEKSVDRRYGTALALAEDLARVRRGEPVLARPVSVVGRLRRWTTRNPAPAALLAVLTVGLTAAVWAAVHMSTLADRERVAREDSQALLVRSDFEQARLLDLSSQPGRRWGILGLMRDAGAARDAAGAALQRVRDVPTTLALREAALAALLLPDARMVGEFQRSSFGTGGFSSDGGVLALAWVAPDFTSFGMRVVDTGSGVELARLDHGDLLSGVQCVAVEAGGARFVTPRRDLSELGVWDAGTGQSPGSLQFPEALRPQEKLSAWRLAWQPGGDLLAGATGPRGTASGDTSIPSGWALWQVGREAPLSWAATPSAGLPWVEFSRDGRWVLLPAGADAVECIDTSTREHRTVTLGVSVMRAVPTSGLEPRWVVLAHDAATDTDQLLLATPEGEVIAAEALPERVASGAPLALDRDERFVMFAEHDLALSVHELSGLRHRLRIAAAHEQPIEDVAFDVGNGEWLSHAAQGGSRRWESVLEHDLARDVPPGALEWAGHGGAPFAVSPAARRVVRLPREAPMSLRVAGEQPAVMTAPLGGGPVFQVLVADSDADADTDRGGAVVRLQFGGYDAWWPSADGSESRHTRTDLDEDWTVAGAAWGADGALRVLTQHSSGEVLLRAEPAKRELGRAELAAGASLWLGARGRYALAAPTEGRRPPIDLAYGALQWMDLESGERVVLAGIDDDTFREVAGGAVSEHWAAAHVFLPADGDAAPGDEAEESIAMWVWSADTGEVLMRVPHAHRLRVVPPGFSVDGALFAMNALGGRVRLFDTGHGPGRGEELISWRAHTNNVDQVSFSEIDGRPMLVTHARDEPARLWDLERMREALAELGLGW